MGPAIPIPYTLRSLRSRWRSNLVAVAGIAGVVAVFIAMLAMAKGFQATLVESGSPKNAIIMRGGASTEMESVVTKEELRVISDAPQVARDAKNRAMASGEVVVITAFKHKASGSDALGQVRGVTPMALEVHDGVRVALGRFLNPGTAELVAGRNASEMYEGLKLGDRPRFGGLTWTVVGILDAKGSAYDSEVWADNAVLNQTYKRPLDIFSSVTVRLAEPSSLKSFKAALAADPRLTVSVQRENEYYASQSRMMTALIKVLGFLVAGVMGVGAVFGAFNTMYLAVSARSREIATLRALGFGPASVVAAFLLESLLLAFAGGVVGCAAAMPLNGVTTSTLNFQSFSQIAFAFRITPGLMAEGVAFALFMGFWGGLLPSLRAARLRVAQALREL